MPGIGNPNFQSNPFKGIKMAPKSNPKAKQAQGGEEVGDRLNDMAGVKKKSIFKDAAKHNQMGKDAFLKLLTHQLKNQDPYKPMDQKKFAADLAQFSQLEQLSAMNQKMDGMNENVPKETKFYGASFLGKQIETADTSLDFSGEGSVNLPFSLKKPASKVMVRIFDSSNQMIQQLNLDSMGAGGNSVTWDGNQNDGYAAKKGVYHFEVRAWDSDFNEFKGETKAKGIVTGVNFDEIGNTVLTVDNKKKVFLRDVKSFQLPEMTGSAKKMPGLKKAANNAYNNNQEITQ